MNGDIKCCQIDEQGYPCREKAVATYKNKPLCKSCFIHGAKRRQNMNRLSKYQTMIDNDVGRLKR